MAYETGTASDVNDLLDKLRVFLTAEGWTINRWADPDNAHTTKEGTADLGKELSVESPAGDGFFHFRSVKNGDPSAYVNTSPMYDSGSYTPYGINTGILITGSDAYDGAATWWDGHTGYPRNQANSGRAPDYPCHGYTPLGLQTFGPYAAYYFMMPDAETCYVIVETTIGTFFHFGFGKLATFNSPLTGNGRFFFGMSGELHSMAGSTTWLTRGIDDTIYAPEIYPGRAPGFHTSDNKSGFFVRGAEGIFDGWFHCNRDDGYTGRTVYGGGIHDRYIREFSHDPLNGVGVLLPNVVSVLNGDYLMPLGSFVGLRGLRMDNYLPGDEFSLGGDTWKVFPWYSKGGYSLQRGFAYLKVV